MRYRISGNRKNGFTLVEVVIAMTILSVVVTILAGVFVTNADVFRSIVKSNDDLSDLRLAAGRMAIEIRSIRDKKSIQQATGSSFRFQNDDGDQVRLEYDGRSRVLLLNANTLAADISSCRFVYYDAGGRQLDPPRIHPDTNIWSVGVELAAAGAGGSVVKSRFYPRNLL